MSIRKRVAWIDPSGKLHTILAEDMEDASKQISELRKSLGFPQPDVLAGMELVPGSGMGDKHVINADALNDEQKKYLNKGLAEGLAKLAQKNSN